MVSTTVSFFAPRVHFPGVMEAVEFVEAMFDGAVDDFRADGCGQGAEFAVRLLCGDVPESIFAFGELVAVSEMPFAHQGGLVAVLLEQVRAR
jgi:hypothetical protein